MSDISDNIVPLMFFVFLVVASLIYSILRGDFRRYEERYEKFFDNLFDKIPERETA